MKTAIFQGFSFGAMLMMLTSSLGHCGTLEWQTSKAAALAKARTEGKLVLLLAGRDTCGNCTHMKGTVCESVSPAIKALIQSEYVPWYCDVDRSQEWATYASGLGSFYLPMIACIDPARSSTYMDRTTNIQTPQNTYGRLLSHVSRRATNAPATSLSIAGGRASVSITNLQFGKTIRIERSEDLKAWTQVGQVACMGRCTNWSEPLMGNSKRVFYRTAVSQ